MIDHGRLAAMGQGNQWRCNEIVAQFRQVNASDARLLRSACASDDFPQLMLLAHRMKGACLMLGASGLAEACSLVALAGRAGSSANAVEALAFYDRESAVLDAYLAGLTDSVRIAAESIDSRGKLCEGLRFVVAEDHAFQRDLIVRLLRRLGADVAGEAEDGAQALEQIRDAKPAIDILVLDMSMPGMDGIDLIRKLAEAHSPIGVILNSALSPSLLSGVMRQARECDARLLGVIGKPLTEAGLQPLVEAFRATAVLPPASGS